VIALDLPFTNAGVPWNSNFDATAFNYTLGVILVGILVGIWWVAGAKNKYHGPVRTLDTDDEGRVVDAPPPAPPAPAPASGQ
jgi:hypothetical protein